MENQSVHAQLEPTISQEMSLSVLKELEELRHFKDTALGLWCIDHDPKEKSLDWIRDNAFQLT